MAIDIGGATIQGANNAISITTNSITGLSINSSGFAVQSSRPYFVVQGPSAAWINYSSAAWNTMAFSYEVVDNGNNYNTSNGRFTAPVSGTYYFHALTYTYKNTATTADSYTHPLFIVNGSYTTRQATYTTPYRLRSRTYYDGTYSSDTEINDIFYLSAGDYVQFQIYSSSSLQYYDNQTIFDGFLIG